MQKASTTSKPKPAAGGAAAADDSSSIELLAELVRCAQQTTALSGWKKGKPPGDNGFAVRMVLQLLAAKKEGMGLREVARAHGVETKTAWRLATALAEDGYLTITPSGEELSPEGVDRGALLAVAPAGLAWLQRKEEVEQRLEAALQGIGHGRIKNALAILQQVNQRLRRAGQGTAKPKAKGPGGPEPAGA